MWGGGCGGGNQLVGMSQQTVWEGCIQPGNPKLCGSGISNQQAGLVGKKC